MILQPFVQLDAECWITNGSEAKKQLAKKSCNLYMDAILDMVSFFLPVGHLEISQQTLLTVKPSLLSEAQLGDFSPHCLAIRPTEIRHQRSQQCSGDLSSPSFEGIPPMFCLFTANKENDQSHERRESVRIMISKLYRTLYPLGHHG